MKKKIIGLCFAALFGCMSLAACAPQKPDNGDNGNNGNGGDIYGEEMPVYSTLVESIIDKGLITGADGLVDTSKDWGVGGTDLGFPIYNSKNETMYLAFGDTFNKCAPMEGNWRSNVLANSKDFDLSNGLAIEGFLENFQGRAKPVIDGLHYGDSSEIEVTKIPTGGIEINGTMYMFYMSIRDWRPSWAVNYNGAVKSVDNGLTWERVYDLTWVESDSNAHATKDENSIKELAERSVTDEPGGVDIDISKRVAPNFGQIFPIDGKDGYIYIFGVPGGRSGGIKMGRVKTENFEKFDEYEYFTGITDGKPVYRKGSNGLKFILSSDASFVIPAPCSEINFVYNKYLKKWMAVYLMDKEGKIIMRTADNIHGPYSAPETLVSSVDKPTLYGGHVHEKYMTGDGKTFYFIMSQWTPIYNSLLIEVKLK